MQAVYLVVARCLGFGGRQAEIIICTINFRALVPITFSFDIQLGRFRDLNAA